MVTDSPKLQLNDAVEAAISRVLTAEVAARDAVARARSEAVEIAEEARETARRLGLHTDRRIRAVRAAFDAKGTTDVAAMEAQAVALGVPHELTSVRSRQSRAGRRRSCQRADRGPFVIEAGSVEYAHARLCARYGSRPDELAWRRIEMIRDFGAMLDAARASPLGDWLTQIGPDANVHAVELALRAHMRERIAAIAAWMPSVWRAAIEWCGVLVDLPALQHLARGGAAPAWLRDDPLDAALRDGEPGRRGPGPASLLAAARVDPDRLASLWRAEWQRRVPVRGARSVLLTDLIRLLTEHAATFREPSLVDGWALRRALHARLSQLFRRATLDPAAAFIFLAISALDCERLRGEILRRVAFPRLPLAT